MLSFEPWHMEEIRFEELPTARDVLAAADPALVADALHPRHAALARSMGEETPTLAEAWERTEAALGSILATPPRAADGEHVLIASTALWQSDDGGLRVSTEARLVMRGDLALYARHLDGGRAPDPFCGEAPAGGWAFELEPWEEILSWRAWVPGRMCEREAYQFVADLVWEMTFFGDDHDSADARRAEFAAGLERSVAEVDEARAEGRLEEVVAPFDPEAELAALGVPDEELDYMDRMWDVERVLTDALFREFHRDCVELGLRLA